MKLLKQIENLITTNSKSGIVLIDAIVERERLHRGLDSQTEPSRMAADEELSLIHLVHDAFKDVA